MERNLEVLQSAGALGQVKAVAVAVNHQSLDRLLLVLGVRGDAFVILSIRRPLLLAKVHKLNLRLLFLIHGVVVLGMIVLDEKMITVRRLIV